MRYDVHLYREMRLLFEGIEAGSHDEAAAVARRRPSDEADFMDDCHGEDFAALVDVTGDDTYEQSRFIAFEAERLRQAAPKLLKLLDQLTYWVKCDKTNPDNPLVRETLWSLAEQANAALARIAHRVSAAFRG